MYRVVGVLPPSLPSLSPPPLLFSDNKPHKVTIATLPLPATFRHYCVPRMAPMAYVLAVCTNSTRFTLLGSKEVNVFLGTCRWGSTGGGGEGEYDSQLGCGSVSCGQSCGGGCLGVYGV